MDKILLFPTVFYNKKGAKLPAPFPLIDHYYVFLSSYLLYFRNSFAFFKKPFNIESKKG
jgi:hypothetical protein